jgi:hypothetical protein
MPDSAMVFFLTVALYATARYLSRDGILALRRVAGPAVLLALAYLAKPVAALALIPLVAMLGQRLRAHRAGTLAASAILIVVPLAVLALYDRRVASYAEWHWASGITQLHVLPALRVALTTPSGFVEKFGAFFGTLGMLRETMAGKIGFALALAGFVALPWMRSRSNALLWGWLLGGFLYAYAVVTVERVDYYLFPLLPLAALIAGGLTAWFVATVRSAGIAPGARYALLALVPIVALAAVIAGRSPVASYYRYNKQAYRDAAALDAALPRDALVVIGHYGPDVQYYIDRFGWEEDPAIWTPFDEESAIRKGARYFVSIEDGRLQRNADLCAWLQRFPLLDAHAQWPVYRTDPALAAPHADDVWREYRDAERIGRGRAFLSARGLCATRERRYVPSE